MTAKRIIPCLDTREGKVVKGTKFQDIQDVGDPVEFAKRYCEQGADELVLLDITASLENRKTRLDLVEKVAKVVTVPFAIGGGVGTVEDVSATLEAGADKVGINTAAVKNPELIRQAASKFGSGKIVVAIDAKKRGDSWIVVINGGKEDTELDAIQWAERVKELGAGEILLTSWDADGMKTGYDLELTRKVAEVGLPVVASGGAGTMEDIYKILTEGKADAALAASILHFGECTVGDIKSYLKER